VRRRLVEVYSGSLGLFCIVVGGMSGLVGVVNSRLAADSGAVDGPATVSAEGLALDDLMFALAAALASRKSCTRRERTPGRF
jgi:hypothetical protein